MGLTPSALALGGSRLLDHRTSILINKMRKTIASQNIIGTQHPPSIFYPFPFPHLHTAHQNYSFTCQKLICDSLTMNALAPTTAHDQTNSAIKPPQEAENKRVIVLNKVPLADDPLGLSRQSIVEPHLTRDPKDLTTQQNPFSPTDAAPQANPLDNNSSLLSQGENLSMLQSTLQVDMTHQINKYFEQCASNIREFEIYRDKFVLVSNHKIKKQIKRGQLEVSDKCEGLSFKERGGARGKSLEAKRRAVEQEKYEAIRKLKTIQQQQIELMHKAIKQGRNKSVEIKKSPFTQQQRQKVAEILKAKQQFEKSLQQKTDEYIKNNQLFKKWQYEQQKKMQQIQNNRKKQEIAKRLKEMELKTYQRKQSLKQSALKVPHNYAHKKIERKYRSLQKISQVQTETKLKEISMKHKLNIEQIKEHDRKYSELLEKRSQSLSLIKAPSQSQTKRYNSTKFSKVVQEQLFEIKQKNMQTLMKVKENQYKAKIAKYQQKIDQEHKPKVDTTKSIQAISRAYSSVSLTKQERVEKGLEYLAKAKQMKRSASQIVQQPKVEQNYGYKAYKDYLKERESSQNVNATEKQLKQIMAKKDNKDYRELLRAKFLAEGLQEKSKKRTDDKVYFSAKMKLSLLSQLYSQI